MPNTTWIVQYDVLLMEVKQNIDKVDRMLLSTQKRQIISRKYPSFILLPEMAFTGYEFKDAEEISPFLECATVGEYSDSDWRREAESMTTLRWSISTARNYRSYVVVGFPEKHVDKETGEVSLYNSAYLVNPLGDLVAVYRKHFLFSSDKRWCKEGDGFKSYYLEDLKLNVGIGICMDMNPYEFTAPWDAFEFANYHLQQGTDIIFCCNNWLLSQVTGNPSEEERSLRLQNYWAARMTPIIMSSQKPCYLFVANRIGSERGTDFGGSSCGIDLTERSDMGLLFGNQEAILTVSW